MKTTTIFFIPTAVSTALNAIVAGPALGPGAVTTVSLSIAGYSEIASQCGGSTCSDAICCNRARTGAQHASGAQPADHRAETRIKQCNRLHRLFELAEFPCQLRPEGTNPVKRYLRPEMDADKLFSFLFPSEALALLRGISVAGEVVVPLARRVLYALAL